MGFYDEMAEMATELLSPEAAGGLGQGVITLTKLVSVTDPDEPWNPGPPTPTPYTLKAVAKGVSKEFIDGTTIVATDIEITAAAFGAEPDPAEFLSIDGKAVTLLRIMRLPAAGTLVAWKFVVRG